MGIGDYICVTISGGAPWGFRLQGGKEHKLPLQISKVRKKSKACRAGLCEGDEMISINGKPCSELTHSEAMQLIDGTSENLQILIKRPISEKADQPEYEDYEGTKRQETVESRMQVSDSKTSCKHGLPFELYISESQDEAYYGETESDTDVTGKKEGNQRQNVSSLLLKECTPSGESRQDPKWKEKRGAQHTAMVELQLSLTQGKLGDPETTAVTVIGAEKIPSAAREPTTLYESIQKTESAASETNGNVTTQTASATISHQNRSDKKVKLVESELQGTEADSYQSRVELSLDSSDREHSGREASTSEVGSACADSLAEDGQSKTRSNPPFLVGISSEGTEPGSEGTRSGKDSTRTHKHRARQAKIRRSESLSEKQVKEAKSKCKSIALLLTATPTPSSKGALMFKKRRQRAKKYTLVSYGTGEFDPDDDQEDSIEFALVPTSDSDLDEDFCADVNSAQVVTFDWDTGLVEVEKKEKTEDEMQRLPESKGKGALLFAKRKQRIDQFTAEQEEMRRTGANEAASTHTVETENLYQTTKSSLYDSSNTIQNHATENYIDVSKLHGTENVRGGKARSEMVIQNSKSAETNRAGAMNRTAIPFPGVQNRAAAPFSPTRNVANSLSNVPPPPPYSSISPPPDNIHRIASPPLASVAQPAKWSPMGIAGEQIASRDERICVPAIKTGILQDARKRNTTKPMFTFVDRPKVAPNPELLSMVKGKTDRRRGVDQPGGGFESGPEEDYLSLGAEASNFLQTPAVKQKKPPPVAPKPFVKSPPTGPNPTLPPLSPPGVTSAQAPVHSSKSAKQMSVKLHSVQPVNTWYQSQGSANQFVSSTGPQSVTSTHSYPSKMPPTTPIANSAPAGGMGPAYEMPALKGPSFNQANTASADEEHIYSSGKNVFVPPSYASYPKQESSALSVAMAPRPKFSAKKVGVTAQAQSKGFQPVQVPEKQSQYNYSHGLSGAQAMKQPGTPLSGRPASQSEKIAKKKLTPWDAASQSAVGSVEEAFSRRNIQESIAKNIVSAARRKTLPEPPEEWKARVAYVPPLPSGYSSIAAFQVRRPSSISSSVKTTASIPTSISQQSSMYKQPLNYQQSLTDSDLSTGTCSEHETSGKQVADPNYNPYPRGWKKQR
ncbi:synaptopodin-2-like isoform X2 [Hemiscyllium ocellatum]|uniref:synaptopodin-2-like isoform X2 n=1 Tax=Hemiscyllium ocellatum TaxID=170820 RepID=UPI0029674B30|nr:synaptopodin-2-like isoform X2 [Hemiscyllium ocellatum]